MKNILRKLFIGFIILISAAIIGGSAYLYFNPEAQQAILERRNEGTMNLSRDLAEEGDFSGAYRAAFRAVMRSPNSISATRQLAELSDQMGVPEAIMWRIKLISLEPENWENYSAGIQAALGHGDSVSAQWILAQVGESMRQTAAFMHEKATVEAFKGNFQSAYQLFAKAHEMEPDNSLYAANYAILTLQVFPPDHSQSQEAMRILQTIESGNEHELSMTATANLMRRYLYTGQDAKALEMGRRLAQLASEDFGKKLSVLECFLSVGASDDEAQLSEQLVAEAASAPNSLKMAGLAGAYVRQQAWKQAQSAIQKGIEHYGKTLPLVLAKAELLLGTNQWKDLAQLTRQPVIQHEPAAGMGAGNGPDFNSLAMDGDPDWSPFEFYRLLLEERARRELKGAEGSTSSVQSMRWSQIVSSIEEPDKLHLVANIARQWGWIKEYEEAMWTLISKPSRYQRSAIETYYQYCLEQEDMPQMLRVLMHAYKLSPDNPVAQNNYLMATLLHGAPIPNLEELANQVLMANPQNPHFVSTYAFAQYHQGNLGLALESMEKLPPETLLQPEYALYYGLFLAEDGRATAADYLDNVDPENLLPPERELLQHARRLIPELE